LLVEAAGAMARLESIKAAVVVVVDTVQLL
jgi:hypothetical protein